jgi:hypothetical protein
MKYIIDLIQLRSILIHYKTLLTFLLWEFKEDFIFICHASVYLTRDNMNLQSYN